MPVDTIKELERKPYSSESMRVRCPHCRKLYLVQFNDIKEAKPRFECVQCHSRFWLSLANADLSSEVIGLPVHVKAPPKTASLRIEGVPPHSEALEAIWKRVMADYGNESLHVEFLRTCQKQHGLPYAASLYGQMNKLMPGDEITVRRLQEVQALGAAMLPQPEPRVARQFPRVWQVPLLGAVILIVFGMVSPMFRNMVGVGAALLFLAVALRIQMRRR